jgi:choloylglycine hydrolase
MCTAVSLINRMHLFGRTLDLECSYGENLVSVPPHFPLDFRYYSRDTQHLAFTGVAHIAGGIPLFYDGVNESGLAVAALNFPKYAVYREYKHGMLNIASFELIPLLLSKCKTVSEARAFLSRINITGDSFSAELPPTQLHWIVADRNGVLTAEPEEGGLKIYDNTVGVLSNSPDFSYQMKHLADYMQVDSLSPDNRLCPDVQLSCYSRGMGGIGLPGDWSSSSRFVRAVYAKNHISVSRSDIEAVTQFFYIMSAVSQPEGCVVTDEGRPVRTVYTSCIDTLNGRYYFTTYYNRRIRAVSLHDMHQNLNKLKIYPMTDKEDIEYLQ